MEVKNSKTLIIPDIGEVLVIKKRNIRNLNMTIRAGSGLKVSIPVQMHYSHAEDFIRKKKSWILKHLDLIAQKEKELLYFNENAKLRTPEHILHINEALRREAKSYLPRRLKMLALRHGFSYRQLNLKNLKSRWGSCSGMNNININIQIMRLPNHLIDYVLLHELCHTREKNHGKDFWDLMERCLPEAHAFDKELNHHASQI